MSNTRLITATNKITGEIISGNIEYVVKKLKTSKPTLYEWMKKGETDKYIFTKEDSTVNPEPIVNPPIVKSNSTVNPSTVKLDPLDITSMPPETPKPTVSTNSIVKDDLSTVKSTVNPLDKYLEAQRHHLNPEPVVEKPKTIIPSGPCVIKGCGRTTYHTQTIDGEKVFICFNKCQDIPKHNSDTIVRQDLKETIDAIKNSLSGNIITTGDKVKPPKPKTPDYPIIP